MPKMRVLLLWLSMVLFAFLAGDTLAAATGTFTAFGPKSYTRGTGAPVTVTDNFSILNPNTQYTLRVDNGGLVDSDTDRVSSTVITVNGIQVVGPNNFNQNVAFVEVSLTLQLSNQISVQVRGAPGGTLSVRIVGVDNDPPVITATATPAANAAGWNNSNVTVTFTCSDATSGVATCPPPQTITTEGANQVVTGTAVDNAGLTASTSVTINLDKTPPGITASSAPAADSFGWNNTAVTVTFNCADALSGVATCPSPVTLGTQGANQAVTGTAIDKAGNSASVTATINIDETPPSISANATPVANAAGWNNTNVNVVFTCSDSLSGIASCPPADLVSSEGANQSISGSASDKAGNSAIASLVLNIDKTPPVISSSLVPAANSFGWNNTTVTVNFTCSDALSGVASCASPVTFAQEGAGQTANGTATDVAGNTSNASATVNIDETPPTITASAAPAPNQNGWNNTSVTVSFTCADNLSGVASCPAPQTASTEGANQAFTGTASDEAGNTASAKAVLNIDETPPVIAATVSPSPNSAGWNNSDVTVSFQCSDSLSGVATCASPQTVTSEGANQAITGTATDIAGNSNSATANVNLDKTPPVLNVASPSNGAVVSVAALNVNGTVTDALSGVASVTCNGTAAVLQGSVFNCSLTLNPGANLLQVVAIDVAGNTTTQSLSVTLGAQLTIVDFTPKSVSAGSLVNVTGTNFIPSSGGGPVVSLNSQNGGSISAPVASFTATSITFVVPAGAASGPISVTAGNQSTSSAVSLAIVASSGFSVTAGPASSSLIQGQSTAFAVTLNGANGFNQLAMLSVTGVPAGINSQFNPPQITSGQTAVLTLTAPANQGTGTANLVISASATVAGIPLTQSANVILKVQPIATSFMGRTTIDDAMQTPLSGVRVTFLGVDGMGGPTGCSGETQSDDAGNFSFIGLASNCGGEQLVRYDGSSAATAKDKASGISPVYAGVDLLYDITANQVTTPSNVIRLPRVDDKETALVSQNDSDDQTFTFKTIPGLSVTVYAGTTLSLIDGSQPNPFPLIAIKVPIDRLPDEMPMANSTAMPFIVAFQPANAVASQPVAVNFPNTLSTPPGVSVDLKTLNPTIGMMVHYGTGTVSADGTQIVPDFDPAHPNHRFGLVHFDWHGPQVPSPNGNNPSASGGGCSTCPSEGDPPPEEGDPVDLASGLQIVRAADIAINGSRGPISVQRLFRTGSNTPGPFGIGSNHQYGYRLTTFGFQGQVPVTLVSPDGNQFSFNRQPDGTFANSTVPAFRGAVLSGNGITATLKWKDGTAYHFQTATTGPRTAFLSAMSDANGNTVSLTLNPEVPGQVTQITDPVGRSLRLNYDGLNRVTSVADPTGRTVQYTYNNQGSLASVTDPAGGVTQYAYDSQNNLISITDARGLTVAKNTYDGNGRVIQQVRGDGGAINIKYDLLNGGNSPSLPVLHAQVTDPQGNTSHLRFSPAGLLTDVVDAAGQLRTIGRDSQHNDIVGSVTGTGKCAVCPASGSGEHAYVLDEAGNAVSWTDAMANTTGFTYDPAFNRITSIKDPLGNITRFAYDSSGNLLTSTNALGRSTTFSYNQFGQVVSVTDALNQQTKSSYDDFGNLQSITDALGNVTSFTYDALSRPILVVDALGHRTSVQYDALDRVVGRTDANGNATRFSYDAVGNLVSVQDARGNSTTFTYDSMNRLLTRTDALGKSDSRTYDKNGNLIQFLDRRGQTSRFAYDALNRLIQESYQDGNIVTRNYDANDRLVRVADSAGGIFDFAYDARGRLLTSSGPVGTVQYTYDADGRIASLQVAGQDPAQYTYDAVGNLLSVSLPQASAQFAYNARSQLTQMRRANGVTSNYQYDSGGRLTSLVHSGPAGTINAHLYTYNARGERTSYSTDTGQSLATEAAVQQFDNANRLAQRTLSNDSQSYQYDDEGNLIAKIGQVSTTTYKWDSRHRLQSLSSSDGETTTFKYDFAGNLVSLIKAGPSASIAQDFVLDKLTNVAHISSNNGDSASVMTGQSIDQVIALVHGDGRADYGLTGALASTAATVDQSGNRTASFSYEPFGQTTSSGSNYPFQFTGRIRVADDLYYYRARYYDSRLGRFINADPIGLRGGTNLYAYAGNNPISNVDPLGLSYVVFNANLGTLTVFDGSGDPLGTFPAANNAQKSSRGPWQPGTYDFLDHTTHPDDSPDSRFGSNGNFVFDVPGCQGCGVHSGRANRHDLAGRRGVNFATNGCIRTTDAATQLMLDLQESGDPLMHLEVIRGQTGPGWFQLVAEAAVQAVLDSLLPF